VGKVKQLELREVIEKTLLRFLDLYSFKLRSVLAELTLTLATSSKWLELRVQTFMRPVSPAKADL
jgi:hypothetical protein